MKLGVHSLSPSIEAILIQSASMFFGFLLSFVLRSTLDHPPSIIFYVISQAAFAAFLTFLREMDWWWIAIQFLFPVLVPILLIVDISPTYYFCGFVVLTLIYWSIFRTQVPYFPSTSALLPAVLNLLPSDGIVRFVDIGSGLGGLLFRLSAIRKESSFVGIEIAPLPWIISYLRSWFAKSTVRFIFGSYERADLGEYDVVFAYLSPVAMPSLWLKAVAEMKPGALLLSYEFIIPDVEPDLCINIAGKEPFLYVWRI
ncbi:class I SAM-dependent methyltransferase [Undibacterium sp. Ren11W]|uniref:class I SAM-dependent methyltransferase n=1 Tax=Undibacterium sp. Ren11W TaxID=3413045 RepID=UPI003BF41989